MKRILLTTTALTMTAGIAAAEVSITGDFRLGFNDTDSNTAMVGTAAVAPTYDPITGAVATAGTAASVAAAGPPATFAYVAATTHDNKLGVYNDAGIAIAMSSTLDNGMTAGVTVDLDGNDFASQAKDKYKFALSNDSTLVEFGSTEYSTITNWVSAGAMATDTWSNQNADDMNVLRAETSVGGLKISASTGVDAGSTTASSKPLAITLGGALGGASYVIANEGSKMGISVSNPVGGATVTTAYSTAPTRTAAVVGGAAEADDVSSMNASTGVKIAYPMGAVVATASYVMESNGTCNAGAGLCVVGSDTWDISAAWTSGDTKVTFATDEGSDNKIEGSTKLGAATLTAGLTDKLKDMYITVSNPLGGGASIFASYAIDGEGSTDNKDEIGGPDYQEGLTIELKFAF
jgi:hypothetical protein